MYDNHFPRAVTTALMIPFAAAALWLSTGCSASHPPAPAAAGTDLHAGPTHLHWSPFDGMSLPFADQGPATLDDPVATGYTRTPAGAALAAIQTTVRMSLAQDTQYPQIGRLLAAGPRTRRLGDRPHPDLDHRTRPHRDRTDAARLPHHQLEPGPSRPRDLHTPERPVADGQHRHRRLDRRRLEISPARPTRHPARRRRRRDTAGHRRTAAVVGRHPTDEHPNPPLAAARRRRRHPAGRRRPGVDRRFTPRHRGRHRPQHNQPTDPELRAGSSRASRVRTADDDAFGNRLDTPIDPAGIALAQDPAGRPDPKLGPQTCSPHRQESCGNAAGEPRHCPSPPATVPPASRRASPPGSPTPLKALGWRPGTHSPGHWPRPTGCGSTSRPNASPAAGKHCSTASTGLAARTRTPGETSWCPPDSGSTPTTARTSPS